MTSPHRPLLDLLPALRASTPWADLATLPTPVEPLHPDAASAAGLPPRASAFIKREDASSPLYGGNKVRNLEPLFGAALAAGASHIWSLGPCGSNHAVATALHAAQLRVGSGALLVPHPPSPDARANFATTASYASRLVIASSWPALPLAAAALRLSEPLRGHRPFLMAPGGATPLGALGYASAALELAEQVRRGLAPRPDAIFVAAGSMCTAAGLLVGLRWAADRRLGIEDRRGHPPRLVAVRITPWPLTATTRLLRFAHAITRLAADRARDPSLLHAPAALAPHLHLEGRYLGRGYAHPTPQGQHAAQALHHQPLHLDTTYTSKVAAAFLDALRHSSGPLLLWYTGAAPHLPAPRPDLLDHLDARGRRFLTAP